LKDKTPTLFLMKMQTNLQVRLTKAFD